MVGYIKINKPEILVEEEDNGESCIITSEGIQRYHHFKIDTPSGRYSKGVCKHCKLEKIFDNFPDWNNFNGRRKRRGK